MECQSKVWWRFLKILWPSQNIRTLWKISNPNKYLSLISRLRHHPDKWLEFESQCGSGCKPPASRFGASATSWWWRRSASVGASIDLIRVQLFPGWTRESPWSLWKHFDAILLRTRSQCYCPQPPAPAPPPFGPPGTKPASQKKIHSAFNC